MYCHQCGAENADTARFCGRCGYQLKSEAKDDSIVGNNVSKIGNKKVGYVVGAMILLIAVIIAVFVGTQGKKEKEYKGYLASAEKYIQELDYEQAETAYLEAITIKPKEKEPYVKLAKLYVDQGEEEKAEEIIKEAEKAGAKGDEKVDEEEENVKQELEERRDAIDYRWIVEPTIDADDIYYVADYNEYGEYFGDESLNNNYKHMPSQYAVIRRGDALGLIDFNGNMIGGMDYKNISSYSGNYFMERTIPKWSDEFGMEWEYYWLDNGRIVADIAEGDFGAAAFYYCDGLHEINESLDYMPQASEPQKAIPVKEAEAIFNIADGMNPLSNYDWWGNLDGKYGIWCQGEMVTDFIYEECGSEVEGLLAVCKDSKWGYVNAEGKEIIPIEYDASWIQFKPQVDFGNQKSSREYCYSASDGYVVLRKNDMWELRDTTGKLAIPIGEFEEIRPVYQEMCWVKKDGKWGVIELEVQGQKESEQNLTEDFLNGIWVQKDTSYPMQLTFQPDGKVQYYSIVSDEAEYTTKYSLDNNKLTIGLVDLDGNGVTQINYTLSYSKNGMLKSLDILPGDNSGTDTSGLDGMEDVISGTYIQVDKELLRTSLWIPENMDVDIVQGKPRYWSAGGIFTIYVSYEKDNEVIASATINALTGESVKDIKMYSEN